jgi:ABC-type polysaccharide/polyol phosphate export permease
MTSEPESLAAEPALATEQRSGAPRETRAGEDGGWVTARPPRATEVLQRVLRLPRLLLDHKDLVTSGVKRDLEARFQGTVLSWAWPLVHPLFLFAVYYFIFTELLQFKMPDLPEDQEAAMGVYMFTGVLAWAAFAESLSRGTSVIIDNGNLIKKLAFPSELLPLNVTLVGLTTMLFAVTVFLLGCLLTPIWPAPGWAVLWLPVILLLQGLFTYGLVLLTSTLQVFLRDTSQLVGILSSVWMFTTPLFWVPELMRSGVREYMPLIRANPLYHLIQAWRGALMGDLAVPANEFVAGGPVTSVSAVPQHLAVFAVWAVGAYVVGYGFFVLSQRRFADEV